MVRYLSDEWLARADAAVVDLEPVPAELAVGFVVTGGPDGDRSYRVVFGPERVAVSAGRDDVGVALVQSWTTARAVAEGRRSAQLAFLDGDIRVEGDVQLLLGHQALLSAVEDRLADLRASTTF